MKIASITLCAALILGNIAFANSDDLPPSRTLSIHEIIVKQAQVYNIDPLPLYKVAKCESSLDIKALGDHGEAKGLLQFHQGTFDMYAKLVGILKPDIWNVEQQAQVASYMFFHNQQDQWTCFSKINVKLK